jgi:hypothetical protein
MGTWDVGTFDNDTAADWAFGLEEQADTAYVAATLARVVEGGGELLDSDAATEGLAAAEVVARLRGNWGARDAYTEPVDEWVEAHPGAPSAELIAQALAAIDRVLAEPSELLDLWAETEHLDRWKAEVQDLRTRVAG